MISVHAHVGGNIHGLASNVGCVEAVNILERAGSGQRVRAARTDTTDAVRRFEDVAVSGQFIGYFCVGNKPAGMLLEGAREREGLQYGLKPSQEFVCAPSFGQVDASARELSWVLLKLSFEALKQCEGIRSGAGKADDDTITDAPYFLCIPLDDLAPHRHHPVANHGDATVLSNAKNGGSMH